ncbi:MAG: hypothetical protein QM722_04220 [Piscinibacter sp.]
MDMGITIGIAAVAALGGAVLGAMLARGRGAGELAVRLERAEASLREEAARAQAAVASAEARAKRDVAALQAEMASRIERLGSEHRAEQEKLARHLTEAYDELDKLRVRASAAGSPRGPDTGQGFPATMPLGDL